MFVISDVHGCYKTLLALMDTITPLMHKGEKVCFVGDLIDRGPDSKSVIDYVESNNHYCVRGNHEDMAYKYFIGDDTGPDYLGWSWEECWARNGAHTTLASFSGGEEGMKGHYVEFMQGLRTFKMFPEVKVNSLPVLVTHSFLYCVEKGDPLGVMWMRDFYINEYWEKKQPFFNIFGHTPVDNPIVKDVYALIDTGCVYGYRDGEGHGYLTAARVLDGMKHTDIQFFRANPQEHETK